jgi:hypothetical protein
LDFEEQKRGLVFALTNTLRTSKLVDMVNGQEAAAAFAMSLSDAKAGEPISLERFYRWLIDEKKLPKDVVAETLIFLKSREGRYQVSLVLPKEALAVDEQSRQRIVQEFVARGASTSGIYQGLAPNQVPKEVSGKKGAAPGPAKPTVSAASAASPRKQPRASPALLIALALAIAAAVAFMLYVERTAPPAARAFTISDEHALRCAKLTANDGYALCRMTKADLEKLGPGELEKAARATKEAAARAGHARGLHVFRVEDNQLVGSW